MRYDASFAFLSRLAADRPNKLCPGYCAREHRLRGVVQVQKRVHVGLVQYLDGVVSRARRHVRDYALAPPHALGRFAKFRVPLHPFLHARRQG